MTQVDSYQVIDKNGGSTALQYNYDEAITLSNAYSNRLVFNCSRITESVIAINNDSASIVISYKIFGTAKLNPNTADITSAEWINLLSPATYDHTTEKSIPISAKAYESFSNPWEYIVVQIKSASGTPTCHVYHRGSNI